MSRPLTPQGTIDHRPKAAVAAWVLAFAVHGYRRLAGFETRE